MRDSGWVVDSIVIGNAIFLAAETPCAASGTTFLSHDATIANDMWLHYLLIAYMSRSINQMNQGDDAEVAH